MRKETTMEQQVNKDPLITVSADVQEPELSGCLQGLHEHLGLQVKLLEHLNRSMAQQSLVMCGLLAWLARPVVVLAPPPVAPIPEVVPVVAPVPRQRQLRQNTRTSRVLGALTKSPWMTTKELVAALASDAGATSNTIASICSSLEFHGFIISIWESGQRARYAPVGTPLPQEEQATLPRLYEPAKTTPERSRYTLHEQAVLRALEGAASPLNALQIQERASAQGNQILANSIGSVCSRLHKRGILHRTQTGGRVTYLIPETKS